MRLQDRHMPLNSKIVSLMTLLAVLIDISVFIFFDDAKVICRQNK